MIEGLIDIYEKILRDFSVHGIPPDAGSPENVAARFGDQPDEQRAKDTGDFACRSLKNARRRAAELGLPQDDQSIEIVSKVVFEGRLAGAMEYRRRMNDPMAAWAGIAAMLPPMTTPAVSIAEAPAAETPPLIEEPWASMMPTEAAARCVSDKPKITGDGKRKATWTTKTLTQVQAAVRLLEKSWGARPMHMLDIEAIEGLNSHFPGCRPVTINRHVTTP